MRLQGKLVFITGASRGIGRACARAFAAEGARLLLAARRPELLQELADELRGSGAADVHFFPLDVRNLAEVNRAIEGLPAGWTGIDILLNNAGLARGFDKLHEGQIDDWEEMLDTNVKGLLYVTRAVVPGMLQRGRGHVINLGSVAGREVYPKGNVYCASKYAVRALTKGLLMDLNGTPIRVSTVDPGLVETDFSLVRFHGDQERAEKVYQGLTPLSAEAVADAILYCATRPEQVNIAEMVLFPTAQASATVIHRRD